MEDEPGDVLRAGSPTALCSAGKGDDVMYVPPWHIPCVGAHCLPVPRGQEGRKKEGGEGRRVGAQEKHLAQGGRGARVCVVVCV